MPALTRKDVHDSHCKTGGSIPQLLRILLVLLVVFVALVTAYFWLDRYQKANFDVRQKEIAEKNEQMMAEYKQTLAEQLKNISTTGETVSRPEPKAQGVDVVDLSSFPLAGGQVSL